MAKPTFEENLAQLESIVTNLEQGNVPLEEALAQFKTGITLSKQLEQTLKQAETTVTQMMTEDGQAVDFDPKADAK
ncbi:exodeoxyribonuclease VII small subunit [Lacticaseibacillus saniviri]|uniref:Exodeoxyribonuclease 7 small subunit n=1 Tax=Lacticaseibacillus saniviri JCM 17471 = DSM 24301 TaxID=1293598 RepID=A0A0R2N2G0_9LACO|nr:exodeoxyribonuclease VII small subunit [Lacticaseibacillus saniviri]KRO18576.1 hypothetical protein IV56_GL000853 [Lacticaseibacillus saniviri JCM 17471 = DSM 24301]MCG4281548.1 exodeoxyribonuclease VII small subunit [Lacticaseibacillus saniviri]